jgi:ribosomal protein S18 acetylase RimI-like enzyme
VKSQYAINIRPAKQSDAAFIASLSGEVFDQYGPYEVLLPQWFRSGAAQTLVAAMNDQPVGYVMLSADRWPHHYFSIAELLAIAVDPRHCHCGVGNRLMGNILRMAEDSDVDILILHTGLHNRHAQTLFEKHGFTPMGVKARFYQKGQSALMMQKEFFRPSNIPADRDNP